MFTDLVGMQVEQTIEAGVVVGLGVVGSVVGWVEGLDTEAIGDVLSVWVAPVAAAAVALCGVGISVWGAMAVSRAKSWLTTEGRVVESGVSISRNQNGSITSYQAPIHQANVTYEYRVNGQTYRSSKIKVGGDVDTSNPKRANETAGRFGVGDCVVVYYDPNRPQKAALEIDSSGFFFGLCMAVVGGVFAVGLWVKNGLL